MKPEKFEFFLSQMKKNWPEAYDVLVPALPRIDRISALDQNLRSKIMQEYGLQNSDFGLLTTLRRSPEPYVLSPTQLVEYMLFSSGGMTKALYRLEEKGMISRSSSPEDRRIKLVQLTEKGKTTIEEVAVKVQKRHRAVKQAFSPEETEQLNQLLARLLSLMEEGEPTKV